MSSSLYQKSSALPPYTALPVASASYLDPSAPTLLDPSFVPSYTPDPFAFYGSSSSAYLHSASWPQHDPLFSSLKRPGDDVVYPGDTMSKRARFELAPALPIYPQRPGQKDCVYYMRTRTCSYGANCKYDHPMWVPAGGIPDWKEVCATPYTSEPLPVRSGEPDCAFYVKTGICKFGSKCKFNHPENKSSIGLEGHIDANTSQYAVTTETTATSVSANGDRDSDKALANFPVAFNAKGLPIRPGESECVFYLKTGSCKFGSGCRFNHPEKAANMFTMPQPNQAVTTMISTMPGTYGSVSIFPGTFPDYGLSLPVADFGLPTLMATSMLPQRPGETPCAFYMKTGVCKFASTCKFHHPLNRKEDTQGEPVKLTLAGFPRREGEQACPFYMKTGTCKYALSCKFDHPPPGEAAAKAISSAGQSEMGEVVPNS